MEAEGVLLPNGGDGTLRAGSQHMLIPNMDAGAWDSFLVPCFSVVSAEDFAVYRVDPHVVVLCSPALGCRVVGFSSPGAGPDLYSCASGVRPVVLDTPGDCDPGMEWVGSFSQQKKIAEKAHLANPSWALPFPTGCDQLRQGCCQCCFRSATPLVTTTTVTQVAQRTARSG